MKFCSLEALQTQFLTVLVSVDDLFRLSVSQSLAASQNEKSRAPQL